MKRLLSLALTAQQAASPFLPDRVGRVEQLLRSVVEQGQHAGVSCLVLHRGKEVLAHTFGVADIGRDAPLQRSAIVRIYSMSKPITAVTALCLVERGVLRLDQPIKDLLPEFNKPEVFVGGTAEAPQTVVAERPITVRMLLNHTAGFSYDFFRASPLHDLYRAAKLWEATSTDDFLLRASKLPLLAQPGTAWNYSIADDVLGVLIERATKRSLPDNVRELVTGPLRMVDTDFDVAADKLPRLASLHTREGGKLVTMDATFGAYAEAGRGFPAGGAGLFSTLDDYARFGRLLAGDGEVDGVRVLSRRMLEVARGDSLAGLPTSRPGDGWGLVCAVVRDPSAGHDLMGNGSQHWSGAASTTFWVDPQEQLVAVLMAQHQPFDEFSLHTRFRTAVYQALR